MNKYLITLTPVDTFFFGGEITFTRGRKDFKKDENLSGEEKYLKKFNESFSSYVVKSNPFPQQTSLLGMLRFLILSNNTSLFDISENKIRKNKQTDVAQEIGNSSFELNEPLLKKYEIENSDEEKDKLQKQVFERMDFKKIHSISPCFLQRQTKTDWVNLFFSSLDYNLDKVEFNEGHCLFDHICQHVPEIAGYKAKDGLKTFYIGDESNIEESELFLEDVRIGINKDYSGKTQDNAFYKQIFYRFADKCKKSKDEFLDQKLRFAFYATLDYVIAEDDQYIVSLGGDNSRFVLQARCVEENTQTDNLTEIFKSALPENYFKAHNFDCHSKVVLLSDAFLGKQDLENCMFSINEMVSFRFLTSTVNTDNYYKFAGGNRLKRSDKKYNLYRKGSVFYFDNDESLKAFEEALKSKERFYQIGYNYFRTIKK